MVLANVYIYRINKGYANNDYTGWPTPGIAFLIFLVPRVARVKPRHRLSSGNDTVRKWWCTPRYFKCITLVDFILLIQSFTKTFMRSSHHPPVPIHLGNHSRMTLNDIDRQKYRIFHILLSRYFSSGNSGRLVWDRDDNLISKQLPVT